jgi:hypothetical protein
MDSKKEQILIALEEKKGIVTEACNSIGLARSTYYKWLNEDAEFKLLVEDIQEVAIDYVEGKLFEKITGVAVKKGETVYDVPPSDVAIIFYLKTRAKKRGYVERQEIENSGNVVIQWAEEKTYATEPKAD